MLPFGRARWRHASDALKRSPIMSIVFYYAPFSSASPVASALAELGVPHEKVTLDLKAGQTRRPEFLARNPNGKVPTLVVDGTPMFEALAILLWLGERHGVERDLWPAASSPARLEAMSWCTWAYVTYASQLGLLAYATSDRLAPEVHNPAQAALAQQELGRLLGILETRLARQKHMLGDAYSLVDLVVASVVGYGVMVGAAVDAFPHVKAWLDRFQSRDAYKAGMGG
jgi:GST-like protein